MSIQWVKPVVMSNVLQGLGKARKAVFAASEVAIGSVMEDLLIDTLTQPPTVPKETGSLRASGSVFVNRKLIATSDKWVRGETRSKHRRFHPTPLKRDSSTIVEPEIIKGTLFYNKPYATAVHEGMYLRRGRIRRRRMRFKTPGSGPKFVSAKLTMFGDKYAQKAAEKIRYILDHAGKMP